VFDPVTRRAWRGAKYLGPYGHDGRFAALRDFVRNVVVNEFAGAEPSGEVLDALVTYIQDIAFLPNPQLAPGGRLSAQASDAARRGEALFNMPFRHDAAMSCASCHQPSSAFVDHKVHERCHRGWFKTKTRSTPISPRRISMTDATTPTTGDRAFRPPFRSRLTADEKRDLAAYLNAVGDAAEPFVRNTVQAEL